MEPNAAYSGRLRFEKVTNVEEAAYPGAAGHSGYFSVTRWPMTTLGDRNPTSFTSWWRAIDGSLEFEFPTIIGATYVIEGSTDLLNWTAVTPLIPTEEQTILRVEPGASHYFYRAALAR